MNRILAKEQLSDEVFLMRVEAPLIAQERRPGQFVILQVNGEFGERIPLTIADADPAAGSITLIFQTVGKTTHLLASKSVGETVAHVVGPLGRPTHLENFGTVVAVGGGIGVAPLYPIVRALRDHGNRLIGIIGARRRGLILLEDRMRELCDELVVCTDDGSYGRRALVPEPLGEICARQPRPDRVFAIGPAIMMKACVEVTRPFGIPTVVSLNTVMVDGTGMCGGCRITVGGKIRFVCVDGPEFEGHEVDFDNMMQRLASYQAAEREAHEQWHRLGEGSCKLAGSA